MKINSKIFKAYDIRGIYPIDINEEVAYLIGRAYIRFLRKKSPKIVIGQDNRLSSASLFKSLVNGIIDEGGNVIDIGLSTSPMFYWACAHFKFDGGINITASHNSSKYNGFKIVREKAIPISEKSGLKEIKKIFLKEEFILKKKGKIFKKNVLEAYIKFNFKGFNLKKGKKLKIVVDTANAVAGILIPRIFKNTGHKIYHLYAKLDGSFPNHDPDPLIKDNLKVISKIIKKQKADLGVAFDGDGDRIFFLDEKGNMISGDLITALISKLILKENPEQKIFYDIRSSNIVKDVIKDMGGTPVVGRIGHSLIKERMRRDCVDFAGEFSGHYYSRAHYISEAPLFILFKILEIISNYKKVFSEIILPFKKYYHSGEINFKIEEKNYMMKKLEKKFKTGKILKIDGLRVDFKDWWFLVRPSNTEPVLRLVVEAKTKKLLAQKTHFLFNILHS